MKRSLITTVILSGAFVALASSIYAENAPVIGKKGTSPYVTHFIFRPLQSLEVKGVGTATLLEAVGTTQNLKGEPMLDKMAARCTALNVESGDKKYIDGACALTDKDGDVIFSTFDTRDLDASQPDMKCGTHIITGGSGKYAGITGREPFACNDMPKLAGTGGYFAMDIPHNTTWEIKSSAMDDPAQKVKSSMALLRSEAAKLGARPSGRTGPVARKNAGAAPQIWRASTNPWQGVSEQPVHHAVSAEPGLHLDESMGVGDDLPDDRGVPAERVGAHRREKARGIALFADRDELAFVGDVERIEAEKFAGREHIGLERDCALGKTHTGA